MPERKPSAPPPWKSSSEMEEVRLFAGRAFDVALFEYELAEQDHNAERMGECVRKIRAVATSLDQFRRVRVRRWTAEDSAQTHTHKGTT